MMKEEAFILLWLMTTSIIPTGKIKLIYTCLLSPINIINNM